MMFQLARAISLLLNPIFVIMPVPYLLVYKVSHDALYALKWSLFSYLFLAMVGLFMLFAVWRGVFTDLDVSKREQRPLLFFFVLLTSVAYYLFLLYLDGPQVLQLAILGIVLGILFVSLINKKIKASLHMATVTTVLLLIGILYNINLIVFTLIPLIAWARIKTQRHTQLEVVVGILCGAFLTFLIYATIKQVFHLSL